MTAVSLVIPTYNEGQNIAEALRRAAAALEKSTGDFEIIVVDDDSPDGTWRIAERAAEEDRRIRVIRRTGERGLATAVVTGWKAAKGKILGVMDGDLQHPPEVLAELLTPLLSGQADVVVASRHTEGGGVGKWNLLRRVVSRGATTLSFFFLPKLVRSVRDPMSGFFLLKREVVDSVDLRPEGYKILLEVLVRGRYGSLAEVPYRFETRKAGGSKLGLQQYKEFLVHLVRLSRETGEWARFLRYCAVGLTGIAVNEGALALLTGAGGLFYLYSSVLAVEAAIISNFLLNELWTFRDRARLFSGAAERLKRFLSFNLICAAGGVVNVAVLWLLTGVGGLHFLIGNLVGIGAATLWNYGLNSAVTWKALPASGQRQSS